MGEAKTEQRIGSGRLRKGHLFQSSYPLPKQQVVAELGALERLRASCCRNDGSSATLT